MSIDLCDRLSGVSWNPLPLAPPLPTPPCHVMSTLPTEILQAIFLTVIHTPPLNCPSCYSRCGWTQPQTMALSHVCKRWREIVLCYSPLWTVLTCADFCHPHWIRAVLEHSQANTLTIRFATCSIIREYNNKDRFLDIMSLIQRSGAKIKTLLLVIPNYLMLEMFRFRFGTRGWAVGLEELSISMGHACTIGNTLVGSDYVAQVNARHIPALPFPSNMEPTFVLYGGIDDRIDADEGSGAPNLRRLSLTDCMIDQCVIATFRFLEELSISHGWSPRAPSVGHWAIIIRSLPHLKRLSIDGAMLPPHLLNPGDLNSILKWLTNAKPVPQLNELNINRCSPACAVLLHLFTLQPKKLQLTCTNVRWDTEFGVLCAALKMWLEGWRDWKEETGQGGYLYVSVQPDGIIVHNRRAQWEGDEERKDASPVLQLTLYWEPSHAMDLISAVLGLISATKVDLHCTSGRLGRQFDASFPVRCCEELEISLGIFDYEDERLQVALEGFFAQFADVKKLRCLGDAVTALASLNDDRNRGDALFPISRQY